MFNPWLCPENQNVHHGDPHFLVSTPLPHLLPHCATVVLWPMEYNRSDGCHSAVRLKETVASIFRALSSLSLSHKSLWGKPSARLQDTPAACGEAHGEGLRPANVHMGELGGNSCSFPLLPPQQTAPQPARKGPCIRATSAASPRPQAPETTQDSYTLVLWCQS